MKKLLAVVVTAAVAAGLYTANEEPVVAAVAVAVAPKEIKKAKTPKLTSRNATPARSRNYAKTLVSKKQFKCLNALWTRESNWRHNADNPNSSAYGIPQMLGMTTKDPKRQINLGLKYIRHRYGSSCNALEHSYAHGWY